MNRRIPISILFLALPSALASAQLSAQDRKLVIDNLSREMIQRYVSKSRAEDVARALAEKLKQGNYDALTDGKDFAAQISADANEICRDAHFRIRFSSEVLPTRQDAGEPSKSEIESNKKRTRLLNAGFEEVKVLPGNIGYVHFRGFFDPDAAQRVIQASMKFVEETDSLIFDIRDNGGGEPDTVRMLCDYLFERPTHINTILLREGDKTRSIDFKTKRPKGRGYDKSVYVLVSKRTGSAAEEFAYDLQNQKRATIIGANTWGGANPGGEVRLTDHFLAFIPVGMARNPTTKTNWEGIGVTPDIKCDPTEALKIAQTIALKKLLETATGEDAERLGAILKRLGG